MVINKGCHRQARRGERGGDAPLVGHRERICQQRTRPELENIDYTCLIRTPIGKEI